MDAERRRSDGGGRALGLRLWVAVTTRQAHEAMRRAADDPARAAALSQTIQHLAAIERLLPVTDPLRGDLVPLLTALRRLRLARPPADVPPADAPSAAAPSADAPSDDASPADDALSGAVRDVLAWAVEDVPRFTGLVVWLCDIVNYPPISAEAAGEEVAALGLDRPVLAPLRELLAGIRSGEGDPRELAERVRRGAEAARRALVALPPHAPERARVARLHAALLLQANLLVPGTMDFDDVDEAVSEPEREPTGRSARPGQFGPEQRLVELIDSLRVAQTGDLARLEQSTARLREEIEALPGDDEGAAATRLALAGGLAGRLHSALTLGGSLQAADAALEIARELRAAWHREGTPPSTSTLNAMVFASHHELARARRSGDFTVLPRLVGELTGLYATLPPDQENRFAVAATLAELHREQAARGQDPAGLGAAARYLREVVETDPRRVAPLLAPYFPALRASALTQLMMIEPGREAADHAVAEVHRTLRGPQPSPYQELQLRYQLGRALLHTARHLDDPDLLDLCVTELARVRELIRGGQGLPHSADALAQLSDAHWLRRRRGGPGAAGDREAALATRGEALTELSADVLLQLGSEHGLAVARTGSAQALWLAYWTTVCDRPAEAVDALELGRALVLRAAAASRGIPELLEARGHPDLARQWRVQAAADPLPPDTAVPPAPPTGPAIPGGLRRRALHALGAVAGADARKLLAPADLRGLRAGLTAAGADALVYLVPGPEPGMPGLALILRPDTDPAAPAVLKLPLLTPGSPPLERYLDATVKRSRVLADDTVHSSWKAAWDAHWEAALRALCDWAWPAAMGPVLAAVGPLHQPPRIVLVPCGPLGAVAWHAARTPYGSDGREHRYACEEAVLSYAPSGAEFLRAAARDRMPASAGQVLVADPDLTLLWAGIEAEALHATCYPDGLRYGEFPTPGAGDAPGTPEDILAVLPGGTSPAAVLHISCHALAGPDPTRSALRLAAPPDGPEDAGRLTVARILDGAATPRPAAAGPLVVLSACETDLSTRDHDEALTLSTALVARGATDVIGSRWAVRDAATALMMAVFHDFVTRHGLAPADALRAAQMWMLDPRREPPPHLHGELGREADRGDLDRIHLWAAFTHQGNPAAARPR
ncbi:CHAT domain-containing protein [Streptomyces cuspidosporus]|uniref:CHAT domain-containing protein n=1 Tax=Streptomyces cuspidosporus TaxID=66882 RepID=A0ABP5TWD3_9ACTN